MKKITILLIALCFSSLNSFAQMSQSLVEEENQLTETEEVSLDKVTFTDRYFYFPNLQAYYDREEGLYLIKREGLWNKSEVINFNSRGYSIRNGNRVLIENYSGDTPFEYLNEHKENFPADYSTRRRREVVSNN